MTTNSSAKFFYFIWIIGLILGIVFNLQYTSAQSTTRPDIIPNEGTDSTVSNLLIPHTDPTQDIPEEQYFGGVLLPHITRIVISAAGGLAFLFIIIGGIQILTAYSNEEKLGNAKKTVTYAVVGLLVAILSYAVVTIVSSIKL